MVCSYGSCTVALQSFQWQPDQDDEEARREKLREVNLTSGLPIWGSVPSSSAQPAPSIDRTTFLSPIMPHAKRQKIKRESTAAYVASQPLFDALRNATTAVSDQKALLKAACDTVQALHVKVINGDAEQHDLYMRSIVTAWAGATETYHDIFRQLVLLTAADPTEGRDATSGHGQFLAMLETARKANELAQKVWHGKVEAESDEEDNAVKVEEESAEEVHIKNEVESDSPSDAPPTVQSSKPIAKTLATGLRKRPFVEDESAEEGADKKQDDGVTPPEAKNSVDVKRMKKLKSNNAKARRKAANKAAANLARMEQAQPEPVFKTGAPSSPAIKTEEVQPSAPVVEYEDVQDEVESRLKAKAGKSAARRQRHAQKKRKRESVDSFGKIGGDEEIVKSEPEPEVPTIEGQVDKPKKKKVKKAHVKDEHVADGPASKTDATPSKQERKGNVNPEKRKPEVESAVAEDGGGKKRKTKHAGKA